MIRRMNREVGQKVAETADCTVSEMLWIWSRIDEMMGADGLIRYPC